VNLRANLRRVLDIHVRIADDLQLPQVRRQTRERIEQGVQSFARNEIPYKNNA